MQSHREDSTSRTGDGRQFTFLGPDVVTLTARMGSRTRMADGRALSTWRFGAGFNDDRTVPSPVIEAIEGHPVRLTLQSSMPHSIHLHGLDVDQPNDGVPSTSGYVARERHHGMSRMGGGHGPGEGGGPGGGGHGPGEGGGPGGDGHGTGFGRVGGFENLGSPFTYEFRAPHAGTYQYHCHVDTVLHVEMGMVGTVIVRPPDGDPFRIWEGGPAFDREYVWHLHTFDPDWHDHVMVSGPRTARYRPRYFMINGRDGRNVLSDPTTWIRGRPGDRILVRANNVGYQAALVRLADLEFGVAASDGRPLREALRLREILIAPGERYDLLLTLPASSERTASVEYLDSRLRSVLGSATARVDSTG